MFVNLNCAEDGSSPTAGSANTPRLVRVPMLSGRRPAAKYVYRYDDCVIQGGRMTDCLAVHENLVRTSIGDRGAEPQLAEFFSQNSGPAIISRSPGATLTTT